MPRKALHAVVDHSFAYGGGEVAAIDDDTIVYECGNGILFSSISHAAQDRLWNKGGNGITAFAVNVRTKRVAVAERSNEPCISIYSYPEKEEVSRLELPPDVGALEVAAIAFSRDGSRLVSVTGLGATKVMVWDVEAQDILPGCVQELEEPVERLGFNPRSDSEFVTAGPKGMTFWKVAKTLDEFAFTRVNAGGGGPGSADARTRKPNVAVGAGAGGAGGAGGEEGEAEGKAGEAGAGGAAEDEVEAEAAAIEGILADAGVKEAADDVDDAARHWVAFAWARDGSVFGSNAAGQVTQFETDTGAVRKSVEPVGGVVVSALIVAREHLVAACEDGVLRWLKLSNIGVTTRETTAAAGALDGHSVEQAVAPIAAVAATPSFRRLVAGTVAGSLCWTELDREEEEEEEEAKAGGALGSLAEGGAGAGGEAEAADRNAAHPIGDFHCGAVLGLAVMPRMAENDKMFATGGQDGTLRVWDYAHRRLLAKLQYEQGGAGDGEGDTVDGSGGEDEAPPGVPCAVTCLAAHPGVPVLAAGFADGRVRTAVVVRTGNNTAAVTELSAHHLHEGPVVALEFAPSQQDMYVSVGMDGAVYFVDARPEVVGARGDGAVVAFARLPSGRGQPQSVAWRGGSEVVIPSADGEVYTIVAPALPAGTEGVVQAEDLTPRVRVRAHYTQAVAVAVDAPAAKAADVEGTLAPLWVASPLDKRVLRFMPDWMAGDDVGGLPLKDYSAADLETLPPVSVLPGHVKGVLTVVASPAGGAAADGASVLASGGADGCVGVWSVAHGALKVRALSHVHAGAVARVCFSRDGLFVLSAGADGAVHCLALEGPAVGEGAGGDRDVVGAVEKVLHGKYVDAAEAAARTAAMVEDVEAAARDGEDISAEAEAAHAAATEQARFADAGAFLSRDKLRQEEREALEHEAARNAYAKEVAILGYRLKDLLARNDKVPDLERLDRGEFVVDVAGRDKVVATNQAAAAEVRAKLDRENLERDIVMRRVREECWDSMETPLRCLLSFTSRKRVTNFAMRRRDPREVQRLERAKTLRKVERCEMRDAAGGAAVGCWDGLLDEFPGDSDWVVNAGLLPPTADPVAAVKVLQQRREKAALAAKGGEGEAAGGAAGESKGADEEEEGGEDGEAAGGGGGDDDEEGGGGGGGGGGKGKGGAAEIVELLYHPAAARSPNQKRTQVLLLKELVRYVQETFNARFDEMYHAKEAELDKINGRNARIKEILHELKEDQEYFTAAMSPEEMPESVLEVTQAEIGFEKYVTEAERARLEEEARRRAAEAGKDKDDAPERALADMMGGTLEAPDDLAKLESALVREAWMDELAEADMTEEQRKALADFEDKQKAVLEQKAAHRKALEQELKKLKSEVKEIVATFDARMDELDHQQLVTAEYVHAQEMHMVRLSMAIQEREDGAVREERLLEKLDKLCDVRDDIADKHDAFQAKYEAFRERHERLDRDDKAQDKNFRASLQQVSGPVDSDTMKILQGLFKQRAQGHGRSSSFGRDGSSAHGLGSMQLRRGSFSRRRSTGGGAGSGTVKDGSMAGGKSKGGDASAAGGGMDGMKAAMKNALEDVHARAATLDPFADQDVSGPTAEQKEAADREEALQPLSLEADCPEGFEVDEATWTRLQELRSAKIESELALRASARQLGEMGDYLQRLGDELDRAEDDIAEVQNERELLLEQRAVAGSNLELLVRLMQGQDEMEAEAVVTDYSDALLINRAHVERTNRKIVVMGSDVVDTLTKIKNFRKDINFMLWEHKYLEARVIDTEEHYTDLHMLRVTKTLQEFLKGGDLGERRRKDLEKADAKLEHLSSSHERAMKKLRGLLAKQRAAIKARREENERLEAQVAELEASVAVRQSIQQSRAASRGGAADPGARSQTRMKSITTRRKLIDLARAQTDEIEFLRQELDRLRQRTFPSFAHSSRLMSGGVDEFA